ncbi:uncharacterized protein M437DRAFT_48047 [Aureobasidium melanogenum CBS 110374]|uniref:MYND-type domain-containing protein n=1 Tax=Aureobasidium melanogenum (strain CBS 110374) TaxID=1043003 RepID=A0A074VUZ4_AURM1|nr:uncharacterized protein M437DRAFT_48047 [Aureobasidium melanogenum CBS 110374]KEQ63059.1 hypothetical protein M437DRAFT_48047 [Aureobasidium melanogenum CBS 110374]
MKPPSNKPDDESKVNPSTKKPNNNKKCTNCGKMDAKAHCTGCRGAPEVDGTPQEGVRYCSKECQKAHWVHHRRGCRNMQARKALFRAGSLLQEMWYAIRRESYDNAVVRVQEINGDLVVYDGDYNVESTLRENGYYRKFPEEIFKNKKDAESCLSLLSCNDVLNHMPKAVEWLLKDICKDITEAMVKVKKPVRATRYGTGEWDLDWTHTVFKAVLVSGETYAIDLAGAQYGFYEPVILWSKYRERCIEMICLGPDSYCPLGFQARTLLSQTFSNPGDKRTMLQRAIPMMGECLKLQFNQALEDIKKRYTSGRDLLHLPPPAFQDAEKDMISMAKHVTRDTAEKVDVLLPLIVGETDHANQMMLLDPRAHKGRLLAHCLVTLAAHFNGAWQRDNDTGRLISLSLKRADTDSEYLKKIMSGKLPEQKSWSDMTLLYQ